MSDFPFQADELAGKLTIPEGTEVKACLVVAVITDKEGVEYICSTATLGDGIESGYKVLMLREAALQLKGERDGGSGQAGEEPGD